MCLILSNQQKTLSYHRGDVYDLLPESFATVEMIPDAVGTWMLHCHVNIHIHGGMSTLFTVLAPTSKLGSADYMSRPAGSVCHPVNYRDSGVPA